MSDQEEPDLFRETVPLILACNTAIVRLKVVVENYLHLETMLREITSELIGWGGN